MFPEFSNILCISHVLERWVVLLSVQFNSVAQSCPILCDRMNHSTPGLPVHHHSWSPPKPMSTESVMPSNHLILCRPLLLLPSIFPSIRVFSNQSDLAPCGPSIGVSASISVLPMNTQDWPPLGWTGWITPQFKSINSSVLSFPHSTTLTSIHDHWKNHSLD